MLTGLVAGALCGTCFALDVGVANAEERLIDRVIRENKNRDRSAEHNQEIERYSTALRQDSLSQIERRELLRRRALVFESAKRFADAEADWNAALAIEPIEPALYFKRGFFYERLKRYDDALADFAAGKALDPKESFFSFGEGQVRSARGEHRLAIAAYNEAIRLNPGIIRFYPARASAYNSEGMYAEARTDYDKVLTDFERKGTDSGFLPLGEIGLAYLGRGYANNHLKDFRRAKDDFDKVLAMVPNSANAMKWRGIALEHLGDRERALADYRAALAILKKDDGSVNACACSKVANPRPLARPPQSD
jgi:tetratricopeptide (TPR) repeat protein